MTLTIVLHPLAERDIVEPWDWYEQQLPGLGDRFVNAVGVAVERAARWPNAGVAAIGDVDGNVVERRIALARPPKGTDMNTRNRQEDLDDQFETMLRKGLDGLAATHRPRRLMRSTQTLSPSPPSPRPRLAGGRPTSYQQRLPRSSSSAW